MACMYRVYRSCGTPDTGECGYLNKVLVPSYRSYLSSDWHRHALNTYTWYRCERGPQKAWLHHICKADDPSCPSGHPS